jgi:8-amino-7-oxononanoate synthase
MLDLTSALYLGFRHASRSLRPWARLTTGVPAALAEAPAAGALASRLAELQGCERAVLASSTLHLFWDLFGMLAQDRIAVLLDARAYPIAGWGVERAAGRGTPVRRFPHHDTWALQRLLARLPTHLRPIVVTDGVCTCCGVPTPLAEYGALVHRTGGWLVVDDTQALGIFGHSPGPDAPYGRGGGGSLRHSHSNRANVILVSSLAKGFGVPLATLSGSHKMVRRFIRQSETRVHCSPPSLAEIHAAERALGLNAQCGDALRSTLAKRVRFFRRRLANAGLGADGALFPVQTVRLSPDLDAGRVYRHLCRRGVKGVLRRGEDGRRPRISFLITAQHRSDELDEAVMALTAAIKARPTRWPAGA